MNAFLMALTGISVMIAGYLLGRKIRNIWLFFLSQIASMVLGFAVLVIAGPVLKAGVLDAEKAGSLLAIIGVPAYIMTIILVKIFEQKKHDKCDSDKHTDVGGYQRVRNSSIIYY